MQKSASSYPTRHFGYSHEDDSKTTAKDLESHEEATLPKETPLKEIPKPAFPQSKIPSKLAPLKKSKLGAISKRDSSLEKLQTKRDDSKTENPSSLANDRASRDYTNLRFQDPRFYERPKLLDEAEKKELDLKEVLKRSESMSPRYEKDWEQLSSRFSSEENIIDIDKLSISSLTKSDKPLEKLTEKFDKEKHPKQLGQQRELTLSGGGSMFLKSNRSRDTTPSHEVCRMEDFQTSIRNEGAGSMAGEKPKSILREKASEDDDRPADEERKIVRFDLDKEVFIKFTYSGSEEEWDSGSEDHIPTATVPGSSLIPGKEDLVMGSSTENKEEDSASKESDKKVQETLLDRLDTFLKRPKVVGKRFLVENVSENEHLSQMSRDRSEELDSDYVPSKFENIKNIDLMSKSDTDSGPKSSESKSSMLEEIRKSKEIMLETMKKSDQKMRQEMQREKEETYHLMKIKYDLESARQDRMQPVKDLEEAKLELSKKYERNLESMKKDLEERLEETRKELEENFHKEKRSLVEESLTRLRELKTEMKDREEQEIHCLISEMDRERLENLKKVRGELELCYEKEKQEILANLKSELEEKRKALLDLRNQEIEKLEKEHERHLSEDKLAKLNEYELNERHSEQIETLKKELEKELDELRTELRTQQREKISKMTEDHEKCLAEILRDFRMDESLARKVYKQRLEEIRADFSLDIDRETKKQNERVARQESIDFEKIRCEKRLLEDKYKSLKEKYLKLKNNMRLAVERRSKRREGNTTASETEKSTSARTRTEITDSSEQKLLKKAHSTLNPSQKSKEQEVEDQSGAEDSEGQRTTTGFPKPGRSGAGKFESDDTTTASETNSNLKKRKSFSKKAASTTRLNNNVENPVENIRKQLEKLEDLGDQLPSNETAYTLRYPFQDKAPANASSELEFFRHRIHVERDSMRRAREALRQQRSAFQGRRRAWKQRSTWATLEQLVQEERELSDMEVSLHRTRSLLGEKVIHLKHLEQSLERVARAKKGDSDSAATKNDELTLSDMSSASSGFSSTDLGTDTFIDKPDHYQESTEIIASLENLNSEIREIWGVLNKRQDNNIPPPPTLMYSDLGWLPYHHVTSQPNNVQAFGTPNIQSNILSQLTGAHPPTTATQNIIAQYGPNSGYSTSVGTVERTASNLMERTRNLRDWLRQARVESTDLVSPGQATL
ncbi:spindle pole body component 110 isoform X2 [Orussus abietinus]|uniref:spindle pole body component 110 isoform X2 n=1 Tax=Orussus abietinus TaxID=222816 RepID=UPI00062560D9|nr:spindle pole body component 110 isoform X2 [Orussus abietinus]